MCSGVVDATAYMERPEHNLLELVLSFQCVGPKGSNFISWVLECSKKKKKPHGRHVTTVKRARSGQVVRA